MSKFSAWMHPLNRQTVRPRSSVRIPVLTCALIFAATTLVIGRWGQERWTPVDQRRVYSVTASAVETATGVKTPFTATGTDAERTKAAAGVLAEQYIAQRVAEWRRDKEVGHRKAREMAEHARRRRQSDAAAVAAFERQRPEPAPLANATRKRAAQPAMIDNPAWLDLQKQIAVLEARRDQLLIDRTPLHPSVQEVDAQLAELRQQLAMTARQIPDGNRKNEEVADAPTIVPPRGNDVTTKNYERKLAELTAALEKSRVACEEAERAEKRAEQVLAAGPKYTLERAEPVANPPQVDYGWRRLLWTTFASGLLLVFGVVAISLGAGIDPPVASVEDVEDDLNLPVLGVVPTDDLPPDLDAIERQIQFRRTAMVCGTILILACPVVAVWGVMGIS